jgi:L-arabinose isomerase
MATPPAWTLDALGDAPLVIWAVNRMRAVPSSFDHGSITAEGSTVGGPMLTSVLVRQGRPFELVVGLLDDPAVVARVDGALRGAAAATRVRGARLGRIGEPLPGYLCVDTDDELLRERTGVEVVRIDPGEVTELYRAVPEARVRAMEAETRELYDVEIEGEGLERSLRAACAIEDLVARHRLDAGAMNCHVPEIRYGGVGVTPCYGISRSTGNGVPWTCVGDVLTAVAMLIGTQLGAAAQYHELETIDYDTGELVIASSGEHDLAFSPDVRPRLIRNDWFTSDACQGACGCFAASAGPGTLLGFADVGGDYRLIAAEGELTGRAFPDTGTANGGFRFSAGLDGWRRWCEEGANHHSSASPGALGDAAAACSRFLNLQFARV